MIIFYNIIVLIFEVLFYSLFMKYSRKDGKLRDYILLFTICSIIVALINGKYFPTYLIFILATYIGLKYIVRTKPNLYDVLVIVVMLLLNVVIELPIYLIFYKLFHFNHIVVTLLFELVKLVVVLFGKDGFNDLYLENKKIWDNNNFNIRYGFTIMLYIYVVITIALKIFSIFKR